MFYKMITAKRKLWFASPECSVGTLVEYMEKTGHLRDAQIDAIKTYLFLKIGCSCKPLWELFAAGAFNSCDLDAAELSSSVRVFLQGNPAAAALYEYACQKNEAGEQVSESLEKRNQRIARYWDGTITSAKKPLRLKIRNICGDKSIWRI